MDEKICRQCEFSLMCKAYDSFQRLLDTSKMILKRDRIGCFVEQVEELLAGNCSMFKEIKD